MPVAADVSPLAHLQLLAEPLRWQLLEELGRSDRRVGELCALVGRPQSLVSYHLRELRDAGLVSARRSSADGRDTYYRGELGRCAEVLGAAAAALDPAAGLARANPTLPRRGPKPRVLFLCTGNSGRSQMAEALLVHRSGGAVAARSAGSHPKPLHPDAVRVMAERGVDIAGRRSKHLDRFAGERFDRVVTLCDKVREVCPELPAPVTAHWSMADPAAAGDAAGACHRAFVETAEELEVRVALLLAQLASDPRHRKEHP